MNYLYDIISRQKEYLVLNKHHGALSQNSKNDEISVISALTEDDSSFLHLINRLDRPVGGLLLIARDKKFLSYFLELQKNKKVVKEYVAIVEGQVNEAESPFVLQDYLIHDRRKKKAFVSKNTESSKQVQLKASVLHRFDRYTALKIELHGGKFHQIRAQLSNWGHPIRGDVKYGARRGHKDRSIDLHAYSLSWPQKNGQFTKWTAAFLKSDALWDQVKQKI